MTILRMDNVGIVVDDLKAAIAFFLELGLELEGETTVEGQSVDRVVGLDGVRSDIAMMRTPDGHGRLELSKFHTPPATRAEPNAPVNTLGIGRIMFAVDDIDAVVARLRARGVGARRRGGAVRGQLSALLCPWPGGHHRRVGRAAQLRIQVTTLPYPDRCASTSRYASRRLRPMARSRATRRAIGQPFAAPGLHQRLRIDRIGRRSRWQPADDHRELAARAVEPRCDLRRRPDQHLLVALGELTSRSDRGGGHPLAQGRQQRCHAVRRLVQHQRQLGRRCGLQQPVKRPGAAPMPAGRAGSHRTRTPAPPRRTGQRPR